MVYGVFYHVEAANQLHQGNEEFVVTRRFSRHIEWSMGWRPINPGVTREVVEAARDNLRACLAADAAIHA